MSELSLSESYCFGFLKYCAEIGVGADEAAELLELRRRQKEAFETGLAGLVDAAKNLATTAVIAPVAVGGGLGAVGGYTLGRMTDPDPDPDDIRDQELIDTYDNLARDAKLKARLAERRGPASVAGF